MRILLNKLPKKETDYLFSIYCNLKKKYSKDYRFNAECEVCGCKDYSVLGNDVIRLSNTRLYIIEKDEKLIICNECGCIRKSHIYSSNYYFEYVNSLYDVVPYCVDIKMVQKAKLRSQFIKDCFQENPRDVNSILEISSYDGVTLNYLYNFFRKKSLSDYIYPCVVGIEPTSQAVKFSMDEYPHLKGRIVNDLAEHLDFNLFELNLDVIVSSHALRMITKPKKVISGIALKVNDNAVFVIDEGSFINTTINSMQTHQLYRQFSQQKINYFTNHGLKYLMESNNFKFSKSMVYDSFDLQGVLLGFIYDPSIKQDERDLELSKTASNYCVKFWKELQKNKKVFLNYLETVG